MPRLVNTLPKYRRHRASGQAVVTLAGHDHYLGPYGTKTSKLAYDRLVGEWISAGRPRTTVGGGAAITITELAAAYLRFARHHYVKNGRITDEMASVKVTLRFLTQYYGDTDVGDFGPKCLKAIQQHMIGADHSRGYINKNSSRIKRILKWGVAEELLSVTIFQAVATVPGLKRGKTQAGETAPVRPVADEVVEATVPYLLPAVAAMVRLQRLTGMRPGEVCMLRPCDVDTSGKVWCYVPESHKTEHFGRLRRIYIGPQAQDVLHPFLLRPRDAYCFSGPRGRAKYDSREYHRLVHQACRRAEKAAHQRNPALPNDQVAVPEWSPNQLRHSAATEVRRRYGLESAQVVLGHARPDMTLVYAEQDEARATSVMAAIG